MPQLPTHRWWCKSTYLNSGVDPCYFHIVDFLQIISDIRLRHAEGRVWYHVGSLLLVPQYTYIYTTHTHTHTCTYYIVRMHMYTTRMHAHTHTYEYTDREKVQVTKSGCAIYWSVLHKQCSSMPKAINTASCE